MPILIGTHPIVEWEHMDLKESVDGLRHRMPAAPPAYENVNGAENDFSRSYDSVFSEPNGFQMKEASAYDCKALDFFSLIFYTNLYIR